MGVNGPQVDWSTKDVFTTGEAADVCRVSQQTIIRCFDAGRLAGFKVPGSKFRRIPRDELLRFMRTNNIPTDSLETAPITRMLLISSDVRFGDLVRAVVTGDLRLKDRAELAIAPTALGGGIDAVTTRPGVVILSHDLLGPDAGPILGRLSSLEPMPAVVCVTKGLSEDGVRALRAAGVAGIIADPDRAESVAAVLAGFIRPAVSENGA